MHSLWIAARWPLALITDEISVPLWPDARFLASIAFALDGGVFTVEVLSRAAPVTICLTFRSAIGLPHLVRPLPNPVFTVAWGAAPQIVVWVGFRGSTSNVPILVGRRLILTPLILLLAVLSGRSISILLRTLIAIMARCLGILFPWVVHCSLPAADERQPNMMLGLLRQ
jgi:hypothetical protein